MTGYKLSSRGFLPLGKNLQVWQEIEPPEPAAQERKLRGTGLLSESGCTAGKVQRDVTAWDRLRREPGTAAPETSIREIDVAIN